MKSKFLRSSSVLSLESINEESTVYGKMKHVKSEINLTAFLSLSSIDEKRNRETVEEGDDATDAITIKTDEVVIGEKNMWATSRLHCTTHANDEQSMHHSTSSENLKGLNNIKHSTMKRSKSALVLSLKDLNQMEHNNFINHKIESNSRTPGTNEKKSVQFSTVEIRRFPLLLGDNPAVSKGAAITIDWTPVSKTITPINTFQDECIPPKEKKSRAGKDLRIHSFERRLMLIDAGYSLQEISRGVQEVNMIKEQRKSTLDRLQFAMIEEMAEKINKRFKKMRFGKQKSNFSKDDYPSCVTA